MARRALGRATLTVVQAVTTAVGRGDGSLLVACSGGPDSLALAAATQFAAVRLGVSAAAAIVDHQLQPDSAAVAVRTQAQLRRLGYADVVIIAVAVDLSAGRGREAAAREARYAALEVEAVRRGATVLLGHTLDDQAETVLLGLARGSGVRSLAGMAPRAGRWCRPLLGLPRETTARACAELGLDPWTDPHNADPAYARARVRTEVMPVLEAELGPGVAAALARTADLARADADLLDELAEQADPGTDTLSCATLAGLAPALRTRVLRRWLARSGARDLAYGHLLAVDTLVTAWRGQRGVEVPGVRVVREHGVLLARPRSANEDQMREKTVGPAG